ncbi:MAG: hypothetical protein OEY14_14485 [Myxococcales bacterium]|nr:hypothetical protein [Myxococcales bacterium]
MSMEPMEAEQARDLFSAAFDAELEDGEAAAFEAALAADLELRAEYEAFCSLLGETRSLGDDPAVDLLAGVQQKLRTRSRGRFYRDRFSRGAVRDVTGPLLLGIVMLLLLGMALFGLHLVGTFTEPSDPAPALAPPQGPR